MNTAKKFYGIKRYQSEGQYQYLTLRSHTITEIESQEDDTNFSLRSESTPLRLPELSYDNLQIRYSYRQVNLTRFQNLTKFRQILTYPTFNEPNGF